MTSVAFFYTAKYWVELTRGHCSLFPFRPHQCQCAMYSTCNESLRGFSEGLSVSTMVIVNCESFLLVKRGLVFKESFYCNWSKRQQVGFLFAKFISNLLPFFQEIQYLTWYWGFTHASWCFFLMSTCYGPCYNVSTRYHHLPFEMYPPYVKTPTIFFLIRAIGMLVWSH